jgi:hypothetical protein
VKPGALASAVAQMRVQLTEANHKIARLHEALRVRSLSTAELSTLRRRVAYYCHPDRGGDAELMRRLNVLFDRLEAS